MQGRVALVTGAAGAGIGHAVARRLGEEGASLVLVDSHQQRLESVSDSIRSGATDRVWAHALDIADREAVDQMIEAVRAGPGPVDVLVNNAAVNTLQSPLDMTPSEFDRILDVDLAAPWYLSRSVLPGMIERGGGSIVNVSSVVAWTGSASEGPYAAAKAGLLSLTRTFAVFGGPYGVRCNAVAPGLIGSKFMETWRERLQPEIERTPLRRIGTAQEVAAVVAFLASDDASFITGEAINVSGGWMMRP
jgi:NAD(P)-dependent dehydrogenase (short-subunit alcohol dehydrogenase family)